MENWNYCIHELAHMRKGDYLICHDPDVRWQQRGWLTAAIEILESDENCVFVCAARPFYDEKWLIDSHGREVHSLPSGVRYATFKQLVAWSTGIWKGDWLAMRPRDFAAAHPLYGYVEHRDVELMNEHKKTWRSLVDFYDFHTGSDPIYCEWKTACAQFKTSEPYEVWLKRRP
jgi:hypothetical protein